MSNYSLKKDTYKKVRGGHSRLLNLYCRKCNHQILVYQKDGAGSLRRLYLDRIFNPQRFLNLNKKSLNKIPQLKCEKCKEILGNPCIYKKENRKAFRIYQDAIVKKIRRLTK